jgi:hypothetical protein
MRLGPQQLTLTGDGVLADGPQGPVLLRRRGRCIEAHYRGHTLVNGSAQAYAEEVREAALAEARAFPLPWENGPNGRPRITHHRRFYEQTFQPALAGIEALRGWL